MRLVDSHIKRTPAHASQQAMPAYLFAAALAAAVYFALSHNFQLTLKPHVLAVWLLYRMSFEWIPGVGYGAVHGLFIIGRDCLGGRLFLCLFFLMVFCRLPRAAGLRKKIGHVFAYGVSSIVLSYAVTMVRIVSGIPFCELPSFPLIHTVLSLAVYFGSALALYAFLNRNPADKGD